MKSLFFSNLNDCIDFIKSRNEKLGIRFGLERISQTLKQLNDPHKKYKTIHIAGTNGKGSTTTMIASILHASGYKVGSFISPKISTYNEMFLLNGHEISNEDLLQNFNEIIDFCQDLTAFEILTVIAFNFFKNENVDYAVIEVGCGGLLDSTNVIEPIATVITNIASDHASWLGDIVQHKLGIIKPNVPLITAIQEEETIQKIYSKLPQDKVFICNKDFTSASEKILEDRQVVHFEDKNKNFDFEIKLLGDYQIINSALALKTCIEVLENKLSEDVVKKGLINAKVHYRFEKISLRGKTFILDAAHNLAGISVLKTSLEKYFGEKTKTVVIGILHDKDYPKILDCLIGKEDSVIVTRPCSERACDPKILCNLLKCENKIIEENYERAIDKALKKDNELIIITGTFYNDDVPRKYLNKLKTTF